MKHLSPRSWLLLSDIHFKHYDLDRIKQTAQWIVSLSRRRSINRVVICGDLLTSRTTQPTHILSACYRFISELSDAVPRINILLGNHDLAYKHDYHTSALQALNLRRLSPYVTIHSDVSTTEWDGRRVLLLPFREDQTELTEAVASLDLNKARQTVAFAHLAINKAITQRHIVGSANSITYRGLTGPYPFASLARTFTGHFHSHQTILQEHSDGRYTGHDPLRGSITYLGSPLQLTWADLHDEQRGVVLLDPETLDHELLVCPHAVGYVTADVQQVLRGEMDFGILDGKHVMLQGYLTRFTYFAARDRLLALGARSVRNWNPMAPVFHEKERSFGASVPVSDSGVQTVAAVSLDKPPEAAQSPNMQPGTVNSDSQPQARQLDLVADVREYVESLELEEPLLQRRDMLTGVGQRLIQISYQISEGAEDDAVISHKSFLHAATQPDENLALCSAKASTPVHVFVAKPRSLTFANFLGVQGPLRLEFDRDLQRGLTFLVGSNGSGKSTLVEAMTWCQFGRCIRSGLAADDVVNDVAGKNCRVSLEFDNGYIITRYRMDKENRNRVVVSLHGVPQTQFEHADARTTQAAIDELLGINYETFVRTVVLGHESAASFLHSSPTQRRDLIESTLGLSVLDRCGRVSRQLLKDIDADISELQSRLNGLTQTMAYAQYRLNYPEQTQERLLRELKILTTTIGIDIQEPEAPNGPGEDEPESTVLRQDQGAENRLASDSAILHEQTEVATSKVNNLLVLAHSAQLCAAFYTQKSALGSHITKEERRLEQLKSSLTQIQSYNVIATPEPEPGWLLLLVQRSINVVNPFQRRLVGVLGIADANSNREGPGKLVRYAKKNVLGLCLAALKSLSCRLQKLEIVMSTKTTRSEKAKGQNPETYQKLIDDFKQKITNAERGLAKLEKDANMDELIKCVALDYDTDEHDVRTAITSTNPADAKSIHSELQFAIQKKAMLEKEVKRHELLQQQIAGKRQEIAMYTELIETEQAALNDNRKQQDELNTQISCLTADREIFAFWVSTLVKKTKSATATTTTFREYLLKKSLDELNTLMAQVLTVLYEDTRHAREMTTGMLRSLFHDEDSEGVYPSPTKTKTRKGRCKAGDAVGVIDKTLSISAGLSYGKRSGGERKRMDLALFFALLYMSHARSRYRAHYLLVDEVFDSLDEAGQNMVIRWCDFMTARVSFVLVITHSQHLVSQGVNNANEGEGGTYNVITASMKGEGTELEVQGRKIGILAEEHV